MRRQILDAVIIGSAIGLGASALYAQGFAARGTARANQSGGVSGAAVRRAVGPSGGTVVAARGFATDGRRNAAGGRNGTVTTSGPMTRGADGSRTTTTTANSGAAYQGQTTYEKGSGLTHTTTCTNAAGAVVACGK